MADGKIILLAGTLLALGLGASLVAGRLRVPALVLFLGVGMAVGSEGLGWAPFDDYGMAQTIGVVALGLILFEGGLTAGFSEIRPVLGPGISLAVIGTIATAVITGLFAAWLFDLTTVEGLLLGSILASTDSAAIFAVLRGSTLRRRLARTLEAEAGLNDPVAVVLVIGFVSWLGDPSYRGGDLALEILTELSIGLAVGVAVGIVGARALARTRLASAGLYPVASLAIAAVAYGGRTSLGGSGFLAVYLAGLALGSAKLPAKRTMTTFHQGLGWVAQVTLFLVLGLLVFPSQLDDVALEGTALALVVVFVARPAGAVLATLVGGFSWAERITLGWAGPARGRAGGARDVSRPARRPAQPRVLQHRLLRRDPLHRPAGSDVRTAGQAPRRDDVGGRAAGAAGGRRRRAPPRRRGHRAPRGGRRRRRRRARAPARAAPRRAGQHRRARRAGDPAAWLDDDRGRRPPAPARAPGGRRRARRAARALAQRPARRALPPAAHDRVGAPAADLGPLARGRGRRPADRRRRQRRRSTSCARGATARPARS